MRKLAIGMMVFCSLMALSVAAWCDDNGTVTVGGRIWLKDAGCLGMMSQTAALARIATLADGQCGLKDGSKAGQWRLPTLNDYFSLYSSRGSLINVQTSYYWTSDGYPYGSGNAYLYKLTTDGFYFADKTANYYVLALR